MKFLKVFLGVCFLVPLLFVLYITVFFDINNLKPEIIDAVKKHTGRELTITDDLNWTIYPSVGINLGGVTLSNPKGFTPTSMLHVNNALAEVSLMPLFNREIYVTKLNLDGAVINLVTRKNGQTSLDGLTGSNTSVKSNTSATQPSQSQIANIEIGGISIANTKINIIDEAKGESQTYTLNSFTLGRITLDNFAPITYEISANLTDMKITSKGYGELKLSSDFNIIVIDKLKTQTVAEGDSIPNKKMTTALGVNSTIELDKKQVMADIKLLSHELINASGKLIVSYGATVPQISADFKIGDLDIDQFLPKSEVATRGKPESTNVQQATEPDLSMLKSLDLNAKLAIKSLKVANLTSQNWSVELGVKNGILDIKQLTADFYQGKFLLNAQVDARQAVTSYQFDKQITGVQIQPLLKDAVDVDLLAGTVNFKLKGSGKSMLPDALKKNLLATGRFEITDGALYDINIAQMIRSAQAKLKGDFSNEIKEERKTDFSSLTGTFSLKNGIAANPDLSMASPLLRLGGMGSANLMTEFLDYRLTASLVNTLIGQGSNDKYSFSSIDIPLTITGSFQKPEYALDTKVLLNNQLKEEADKAKEKLKDSLFKKLGL